MVPAIEIVPEQGAHEAAREALLDRVIGPIRFRRASERIREGRIPAPGLSLVALAGEAVVGTVRLWPVRATGLDGALLLGPLAVETTMHNRGIGCSLVSRAIEVARDHGYRSIVLVGEPDYYSRFGFNADAAQRLAMPGPFERHRLLGLALAGAAFDTAYGTLRPAGAKLARAAAPDLARVA